MSKLIKLARVIRSMGLSHESGQIISLSSKLKRLQLAEKSEEPLGEVQPRDIGGTDKWMMTVAHDLSEILHLHSPAFLGSSARDSFGRGAYAFSASNDAGESVVLKIGLTGEIRPYQKIMELFGDDPPSIVPRIYAAGYFDDIGYQPPVKLANDFGYIVMEELEPMPGNMAHFLQELGSTGESFRILKENGSVLLKIINDSVDRISDSLEIRLKAASGDQISEEDLLDKKSLILSKLKEDLFFKIKSLKGIDLNDRDKDGKDIYDIIVAIFNKILKSEVTSRDSEDLSNRTTRAILSAINTSPVQHSDNQNTPLGAHFSEVVKELDEAGIDPRDLHEENIMIRPGTGEIVISDLGHFEFELM